MSSFEMFGGRLPETALNRFRVLIHERGGFTALFDNDSAGRYVIGVKGFNVHLESLRLRHIEQIAIIAAGTAGADGFGAWLNDGIVYLDAIRTEDNKDNALYFARRYDQLAIYDTVIGDSIYLHNSSTDT